MGASIGPGVLLSPNIKLYDAEFVTIEAGLSPLAPPAPPF